MRYLLSALLILFVSCSNPAPEDVAKQIEQHIAEDNYEKALELVENTDPAQTETDLQLLREQIHLNYGIFLEYRGPEDSSMRERMTSALQQYIEVLKINPDNEKARSEIDQIMSIYSTIPDRSPSEDIMKELRNLGFNY